MAENYTTTNLTPSKTDSDKVGQMNAGSERGTVKGRIDLGKMALG